MSDGPLRLALIQIAEAFHRRSTARIAFVFGTSPTIRDKVVNGQPADVLIIQPEFMADLVSSGTVVAGECPVIARVGLGLMTRADAASADISTIESFRNTLLNADSLVFNNVSSGERFAALLDRLGLKEPLRKKTIRVESAVVFQRIIEGKGNDIGVATIPLIKATKALRFIGPLPASLQSYIPYAAALTTRATCPQAGSAFIRFLEGAVAKSAFEKSGAA
jgi:molybdate transport system substrate-binding protein